MPRSKPLFSLDVSEVERLEQWIRAGSTPQQVVFRARIILMANAQDTDVKIAKELKIQRRTVWLWRKRVAQQGIGTIWEIASGRGRKSQYDKACVDRIVQSTLQDKPRASTHWSTRSMAKTQGVSKSTVQRIWDDHNLKPHLTRTFKLSRDPQFVEKLTDVVGVYMTPPQNVTEHSHA